ncbi:MAG: DUF881 domain-containing protein, partial [Lapillicoccus sp.]
MPSPDAPDPSSSRPRSGRHEAGRVLGRRPTGWTLVVPVVAVLAGLLFATSFQTARGTDLRSAGGGLPDLIRTENRQVETKARSLQALQQEVDRLALAAAPGSAEVRNLRDGAATLAFPVGTAAVHGPSVTVTLDDAHRSADSLPKPYG